MPTLIPPISRHSNSTVMRAFPRDCIAIHAMNQIRYLPTHTHWKRRDNSNTFLREIQIQSSNPHWPPCKTPWQRPSRIPVQTNRIWFPPKAIPARWEKSRLDLILCFTWLYTLHHKLTSHKIINAGPLLFWGSRMVFCSANHMVRYVVLSSAVGITKKWESRPNLLRIKSPCYSTIAKMRKHKRKGWAGVVLKVASREEQVGVRTVVRFVGLFGKLHGDLVHVMVIASHGGWRQKISSALNIG